MDGLSQQEAEKRLAEHGPNSLKPPKRFKWLLLFISQFKSPLILLLVGAAMLSFFLGSPTDATIIFAIVFLSGLLGFFQEFGALNSLEKLLSLIENKTTVRRDGKEVSIRFEEVVVGDVVLLRAGDLVPADCTLNEANHFFANESAMTGESLPVEKKENDPIFMGTMVASGIGEAVVTATGRKTKYSDIVEHIRFRPPETAFEIGVRKFGFFLLVVTCILVVVIFAVNTILHKPMIESFLFALALAVGLTPQLLPAIISVNLSHGARRMAKKRVIVKRLPCLENFGQMNVLCADKTGTLTEGKIKFEKAVGLDGQPNEQVALYGFLNASMQTGYPNPLDAAILENKRDTAGWNKVGEIPYDFERKRLSILFDNNTIITKGAVAQVLPLCGNPQINLEPGLRALAVASGQGTKEENLTLLGLLYFSDPIKPDIQQVVSQLERKGVHLKIITGDTAATALHVTASINRNHTQLITGAELKQLSDAALEKIANEKNVFAEIEPNQKERIILSLRKSGKVVGFLGDGINDVSALHSADVGIAVDSGAPAAKEAADLVLLEKNLDVLRDGIEEGRRTFVNTLKYVYMATSGNFGNMFSMGGASLFLPFLPLLPKQVLLTNFFSDLPEMALASDRVDHERLEHPVKWDLKIIRRFMIVFGLLSSIADYMTFFVLLYWLKADAALFRSAWFIESVVSAALIVLAIRTRHLIFSSRPSKLLLFSVFGVCLLMPILPYTGLGKLFNLVPIPPVFYIYLVGIILFYILSVEIGKYFFFRRRHY